MIAPMQAGDGLGMDNWDDVKFILALSRHGTMTAAAQALGTNVATVSRRIDRITEQSATPLFVKRDGGWVATETATGFIHAAEEFDARIRSEQSNAHSVAGRSDQVVRIGAMPFAHHHILVPSLPQLRDRRPLARLVLRSRSGSLGLGDTDIAIRYGRPDAGRVVARKVAEMSCRAYRCSRRDPPPGWVALSGESDDNPGGVLAAGGLPGRPVLHCDTFEGVKAVIQSVGLPGILPDIVGRTGEGLVPDERYPDPFEVDVWMAYHQSRRADLALRATADWVVDAFAASNWANDDGDADIAAE